MNYIVHCKTGNYFEVFYSFFGIQELLRVYLSPEVEYLPFEIDLSRKIIGTFKDENELKEKFKEYLI